jgi:hypothetical protein
MANKLTTENKPNHLLAMNRMTVIDIDKLGYC